MLIATDDQLGIAHQRTRQEFVIVGVTGDRLSQLWWLDDLCMSSEKHQKGLERQACEGSPAKKTPEIRTFLSSTTFIEPRALILHRAAEVGS